MKHLLVATAALSLVLTACAPSTKQAPPYYHYTRGLLLEEQGKWEAAAAAYTAAAQEDSTSPEPFLALAELNRRRARWHEACMAYGGAAKRGATEEPVLGSWFRCCGWAEDLEGARDAYETYLAVYPNTPRLIMEALRLEIELGGDPDTVLVRHGAAIADPQLAGEAARLLLDGGYASKAETFLRPLATTPDVGVWLGLSLEAQDKRDEAVQVYENLAGDFPEEPSPLARLFSLWREEGDSSKAISTGLRLAALERDGAYWAKTVALYAYQQGAAGTAKELLRAALPRAEGDGGLHYLLATIHAGTDSLDQALREALVATELDSSSPEPLLLAGWMLTRSDRPEDAIALLQGGLDPSGREPRVLLLLGSLLVQGDSLESAIPLLEEAASADTTDPRVFYELGVAYEQLDRISESAAAFRRCLNLDPENASAYNYLGYMLADRGVELEEALRLITTALSFDPDNGYFVDSLGWVYYRLGRLTDARRELERAVQLAGDDPVVREHLGQVYLDVGMRDEARGQLRKALDLGSESEEVLRALEALADDEE
jgi:tetratricopeptide (TPR) repeat protein